MVILVYRNTNLVIEGELHSDLEFHAHPEWMLRDAKGEVVWNTPSTVPGQPGTQPFINFTNDAAREWWVRGIVAAITDQPHGTAIDGVYVKFRHFPPLFWLVSSSFFLLMHLGRSRFFLSYEGLRRNLPASPWWLEE